MLSDNFVTAAALALSGWAGLSKAQATPVTASPRTCSWLMHGLSRPSETCSLPIIDEQKTSSEERLGPWSHPPHCFQPAHKGNDSAPYCLYTDPAFRGGQGVSIVTTPDLAAALVGTLNDGIVLGIQRDHPSSPLSRQTAAGQASLSYEVRDLPGRGKGVVAKRRIKAWETIMIQFPTMVMQMDIWSAVDSWKQSRRLLNRAVRQLPPEQQDRVRGLARGIGLRDPIEDILRTNIFGLDINEVLHMGLFVDASRINHNCQPNVFWRQDAKTLAMEVVALREIEAGEEITYSYVILGRKHKKRQEELSEWGFQCACSLCKAPPDEIQQSDDRRDRLVEIANSLGQAEALAEDGGVRLGRLVGELIAIVDREQLWPQLVMYYPLIARAYLQIGDVDKAKEYAARSESAWIRFQGVDHDNVEGIKELWREVREAEEED